YGSRISIAFDESQWGKILLDIGEVDLGLSDANSYPIWSTYDEPRVSQKLAVTEYQVWALNKPLAAILFT
ncbi:MAG: hypothetical protein JO182_09325, partial [Acidobacteriaceae bacterium]|nr:hypothetical protein [Acidobacteriaceae bacterium]